MSEYTEHVTNHYHNLMIELQAAKRVGHVKQIQLLDHDLRVVMSDETSDAKIQEVADHISEKYRVYVEVKLTTKTIVVYDVYTLDPRV
jgi:hypothetical protein